MYNNNLAAPQRKFETSIFLWRSRHDGRLAGSSGTKLIGEHKLSRDFSIYRGTDVFFQQKIRGASEKFKNQPRPFIRPRSVHFRQHFWNLSHETVPLRSPEIDYKILIPPSYVAWWASTSNRVVVPARQVGNRFLGSIKGLPIRALYLVQSSFCHGLEASLSDIMNVSVHFSTTVVSDN